MARILIPTPVIRTAGLDLVFGYRFRMAAIEITELLGDGIGAELMEATHTLAEALPIEFHFRPVDFSLENRNASGRAVYKEAVSSMEETRVAIKYPTITERESPNAVLRRRLDFSVIHRPVFTMPGVSGNFSEPVDIHVIRVATGGTYADPGRMIGTEAAVSLRIVERRPCRNAAIFAFQLAKRLGLPLTSASKHTIQRITDGLFEDVVEEVGERYPDVQHNVELFDALLAKIILKPSNYRIVLCLNEYGDFLSDMACGLVGSIGLGASASYSFTPGGQVHVAMFDPAGGTAPDIAGQNKANPIAAILSGALMLDFLGASEAAARIEQACDACVEVDGSTVEVADAVIAKL